VLEIACLAPSARHLSHRVADRSPIAGASTLCLVKSARVRSHLRSEIRHRMPAASRRRPLRDQAKAFLPYGKPFTVAHPQNAIRPMNITREPTESRSASLLHHPAPSLPRTSALRRELAGENRMLRA